MNSIIAAVFAPIINLWLFICSNSIDRINAAITTTPTSTRMLYEYVPTRCVALLPSSSVSELKQSKLVLVTVKHTSLQQALLARKQSMHKRALSPHRALHSSPLADDTPVAYSAPIGTTTSYLKFNSTVQ